VDEAAAEAVAEERVAAVAAAAAEEEDEVAAAATAAAAAKRAAAAAEEEEAAAAEEEAVAAATAEPRPMAVPFAESKVPTAAAAAALFEAWVHDDAGGASLVTDPSSIKLRHEPRPVYLPFYVFEGDLRVAYAGRIGYTVGEGKQKSVDYYEAFGIRAEPQLVYAGFTYRRAFVEESARSSNFHTARKFNSTGEWTSTRRWCPGLFEQARPFEASKEFCPTFAGLDTSWCPIASVQSLVEPFAAAVDFAFARHVRTSVALAELAHATATTHLRGCPDVDFSNVYSDGNSTGGSPRNPAVRAAPPQSRREMSRLEMSKARDVEELPRPDSHLFEVWGLRFQLERERLHASAGVLRLPFWVCEYTPAGGKDQYRAFVNAHSAHVAGVCHVDKRRAQAAGAVAGLAVGVVLPVLLLKVPVFMPPAVLVLTLAGWYAGFAYAAMGQDAWRQAGELRATEQALAARWAAGDREGIGASHMPDPHAPFEHRSSTVDAPTADREGLERLRRQLGGLCAHTDGVPDA
jgi:hypothetical protein